MPTFSPNLPSLLALVLLVPLAACRPLSGVPVTSRALPSDQELGSQLDGSSLDDLLGQLGASVTGVWQNYTREVNTFYLGPSLVDASAADSDEACAQRCNDSPVCTWWAFCAQTQGCSFLTYCNITGNATDQQVASGSCILSGENRAERRATNVILTDSSDSSFGWYSGVYQPITSEQEGGNTSAFSDISGLGARRKLRQLSGPSAAANSSTVFQLPSASSSLPSPSPSSVLPSSSVWDQFTNTPNSFTRGPTMLPLATADTAETCAIKCLDNAVCRQWAWCPTERGQQGCDALEWCTAQNAGNVRMPASTCLLTYDDQAVELGRLAYVDMVGSNVTWTSGSYHGSNGGSDAPSGGPSASPATPPQSPSPTPDVSPSPSPSPSPDLSPEPSPSPSSSPSPSPGGSFPPTSDGGCPEGTKNCGGSQGTLCILVQQDRMNCGFCGNMCPSGQSCMGGLCSCPAGQRQCGLGCANILTDTYNCGSCGYSCPFGQSCMAGACF